MKKLTVYNSILVCKKIKPTVDCRRYACQNRLQCLKIAFFEEVQVP